MSSEQDRPGWRSRETGRVGPFRLAAARAQTGAELLDKTMRKDKELQSIIDVIFLTIML
jgi:hypothetical protein